MAQVVAAARVEFAGESVGVEDKGVSVTVHWRQEPEAAARAGDFALSWAQRTGLVLQPGRMAVEFRPPVDIDKGAVVERLARGTSAACFAGDDAGDLAAFAALDRLAREGTRTVRVAVADEETPDELVTAADVIARGPAEALESAASPGRRAPGGDGAGRRRPTFRQGGNTAASWSASQSPGLRFDTSACSACGPAGALVRGHVQCLQKHRRGAWSRRRGLSRGPPECSSANAPASRDNARTPSVVLTRGPSLATRLSPSRSGFTRSTS